MRALMLVGCLSFAPAPALAALCSVAPAGTPCTPDPGPETDQAVENIMGFIRTAQEAELEVKKLRAEYVAIRNSSASDELKLAAARRYLAQWNVQEQMYQEAMTQTRDLYHVHPAIRGRMALGVPSDPEIAFVTGLRALWNPRVTDSGPGTVLAIRIDGSDGKPHYSGTTTMNPRAVLGRQALTLADGRVLVLKGTFDIAAEKRNPVGFLARILYHETYHFDRLRNGWGNIDREERDAYARDLKMAKVFGLEKADIDDIRRNRDDYANAVASGVPVDDNRLTAKEEAAWRNYYENSQVNIEEEFTALATKVKASRERQEEIARKAEAERRARERAEADRKLREAEEMRDKLAAYCGYTPVYQGNTGIFLGFEGRNEYLFYKQPFRTTLYMNDLEVFVLVARACHEVESNSHLPSPSACNRGASIIAERSSSRGFEAKLDYMFGPRSSRSACVNHMFDNVASITDTAGFEKTVANYHKNLLKKRKDYDERFHPRAPEKDERKREPRQPPRSDDERKGPDHDEVWRRINPIIR